MYSYVQSLDGIWTLTHFEEGALPVKDPASLEDFLESGRLTPVPAHVPGNVEPDLVASGELPDPFYGSNIEKLRPLEIHEWWYCREFTLDDSFPLDGSRTQLVFNGVDCIAAYWLNGEFIGESDNMLVEHTFDITGKVKRGEKSKLVVRLGSPIVAARKYDYPPGLASLPCNLESLYIRKAPHMYGWDIMPRAVSAGIWRGVKVVAVPDARFSDLYFATLHANRDKADLLVRYQVQIPEVDHDGYSVELTLLEADTHKVAASIKKPLYFTAGRYDLSIPNPRLWWPLGYGDQPLYNLVMRLLKCDGSDGEPVELAREEITVGIRKVDFVHSVLTAESSPNGEFLFKVNGVPIMVKGSNMVPADAFHSRDSKRLPEILSMCADLGCNMVRCWGGNVYEDHAFFDTCDRLGLMVWQDFSMACGLYPQTDEFAEVIREEAVKVVRKLRNHVSLVIWCGDNECDSAASWNGMGHHRNRLTRDVLPKVIEEMDPFRAYLPSSPYIAHELAANGCKPVMPEDHLWGPRDYFKSRFYTDSSARFVSEIGYHACPDALSVRRFISPEALWPYKDNREWLVHASDPIPGYTHYAYRIGLMADQIKEIFGQDPDNLETFALASQINQAEAMKFFIESTRIGKWQRTGIIWWNCIDGWPQFSDAIVDYYFRKKLAYHYIKRVQQPICPMMAEPSDWNCRIIIGNDSRISAKGRLVVRDASTSGKVLDRDISLEPNQNASAGALRISRGTKTLYLLTFETEDGINANHYVCAAPPYDLSVYKEWLKEIAALDNSFDADSVGK